MIERLLGAVAAGGTQAVYLVHGDLVLAVPAAERLARALAEKSGAEVEVRRHPPRLTEVLDDLATFSLFGTAKVVLAVDTAVLADRSAAADLVDDAEAALPVGEGGLTSRSRLGASRLLQALRLFGLDPRASEPRAVIGALPSWALEGGKAVRQRKPRGRTKKEVEALAEGLAELLAAAREADLVGTPEGDQAELGAAVEKGFPPGHALVLAERSVAADHPIVAALAERGAVASAGEVTAERGGRFAGLDALAAELARETGVGIEREALGELARRTLRAEFQGAAEADSTGRFAGEYRKLAHLAGGAQGGGTKAAGAGADAKGVAARGRIDKEMVESAVEDRGQEDVWQILDAIGAGRTGEALDRYARLLASAEDPVAMRLSFFALLAALCRQITAIRGIMRLAKVPPGERNFKRFEDRYAPLFAAALPNGRKSPLASLKPYRLYKAYVAACRLPEAEAALLPWAVLETELRLKGASQEPDVALAGLIARLAAGKS